LFAAVSVRRSFEVHFRERSPEQEIDDLRREFESMVFDGTPHANILEFRDAFARYTGLAMALRRMDVDVSNQLFAIADHRDGPLATRCLERRNRRRLEFHLLQAKNEFDDMMAKVATARYGVDDLTQKLAKFVEL
jgi:hypothetical protein